MGGGEDNGSDLGLLHSLDVLIESVFSCQFIRPSGVKSSGQNLRSGHNTELLYCVLLNLMFNWLGQRRQ